MVPVIGGGMSCAACVFLVSFRLEDGVVFGAVASVVSIVGGGACVVFVAVVGMGGVDEGVREVLTGGAVGGVIDGVLLVVLLV